MADGKMDSTESLSMPCQSVAVCGNCLSCFIKYVFDGLLKSGLSYASLIYSYVCACQSLERYTYVPPTYIVLVYDNNDVSCAVHLVLIVYHGSMVSNVLAFLFVLCLTMYQQHNILTYYLSVAEG